MGIFPSCDTPYLLNRVEIWRIRRQLDKHHRLPNVLIFRCCFLFNKTHRFLVPGGVVHHQCVLLSVGHRMFSDEWADRINGRGVIEHLWLCGKEDAALRDNKSTVWCLEAAREGFNRRRAAPFVPAWGNGCLNLKMNFVLVHKDQGIVRFYLVSFFLKAFRSSVSS